MRHRDTLMTTYHTIRLLIGITAGYGYAISTLFDTFPLVKMAAINVLMTGRM